MCVLLLNFLYLIDCCILHILYQFFLLCSLINGCVAESLYDLNLICCLFSDNYNLECNHCICINCINNYEKCPEDETDIISGINAFNQSFIGVELLNELKVY